MSAIPALKNVAELRSDNEPAAPDVVEIATSLALAPDDPPTSTRTTVSWRRTTRS